MPTGSRTRSPRQGHGVTVVHSEDAYRALGGREPVDAFPHEPAVTLEPLRTLDPARGVHRDLHDGAPAALRAQPSTPLQTAALRRRALPQRRSPAGPGASLRRRRRSCTRRASTGSCARCTSSSGFDREPCIEPHCLRCSLALASAAPALALHDPARAPVADVDLFLAPSRFTLEAHRDAASRGRCATCRTSCRHDVHSRHAGARAGGPGQTRARAGSGWGQAPRTAVRPLRRTARAAQGRARAVEAFRDVPRARPADRRRREERGGARAAAAGLDHVRASSATCRRASWTRSTGTRPRSSCPPSASRSSDW